MDAKEKDIAEKFLRDAAAHASKGNYDMISIDANSIRYALRAIEERRELLAALKGLLEDCHDEDATEEWHLIAKCEAS